MFWLLLEKIQINNQIQMKLTIRFIVLTQLNLYQISKTSSFN